MRAIERNDGLVVIGAWPRVFWLLKRLAPSLFVSLQSIRRVAAGRRSLTPSMRRSASPISAGQHKHLSSGEGCALDG